MNALGNIDIAVLDGTNYSYNRIADNMHRRAMSDSRQKGNVIKYYTNGLNNKTIKNIDAVVNGLDFVGFAGDGSIEDSEMLRAHIVRTKDVVDATPQVFAAYQQPHQLSAMLGFVIDNWDTPDREAAIDNMAREERKLMAVGAIKTDNDSDAHYLTDGEIYDADRQDVVRNGMVETKPGYRGLFNRIKAAGVNANILSKDADVVTDNTLTRKAVGTLREAVRKARKDNPKMIRKTRIKNGYIHSSVVKLPQQTATTADTIKILSQTPEGRKLADTIKPQAVNGLGEIEQQGSLTELLYGADFAYNGAVGLSGVDNVDNYRRYFGKLKTAIAANPTAFYNTKAEADAVLAILDELYAALGNDAALDNLANKYSQGVDGFNGLGKLFKKVAKAIKKTATKVATKTADAAKSVAKTTANVAKATAKATTQAAKNVAQTTANAAKATVKATVSAAKTAVQSTANATKAAANVVKAGAQAATGNKSAAKETLKKAADQAKSAVVQPVKTVAKTTANVVKQTVVKPVVSAAKTTANAVADTVIKPTVTAVKKTIVEPTVAAVKATVKIAKKIGPAVKKVLKAILYYNPISLLVKAGLIIAFRLNMFKMASRSYAGSFTESEFAAFAEKNGITNDADNYKKFQKSYEKCKKIYCGLGGKESKLIAALKKGSSRKWSGLDAADYTEENKDQFTAQVNEAAKEADNSKEFTAEMTEINNDVAAEEAALKAQGAQASTDAPTDTLTVERKVEVDVVTNGKLLKADTNLFEAADDKAKVLAGLKKGDTVYVDESQADGKFVGVATIDGKNGFVDKSLLADFSTAEGVAINGIAGLVDNGYEYVAGLGEVVTAAAATTAASGSIASICAAIGSAFAGGLTLITKAADGVKTVADVKETIDNLRNDGSDEIEETPEYAMSPATSVTTQPQPQYVTAQPQQYTTPTAQPTKKSNTGLLIGIGAVAVVGAGIFFLTRNNN